MANPCNWSKTDMLVLKLFLSIAFAAVVYEDLKSRQVHWFWFPIIGSCAGALLYQMLPLALFLESVFTNFVFVMLLLGSIYLYTHFKLKKKITESFGMGDALLFIALIFSFSWVCFYILFVFGLLFSLLMHLLLKKTTTETVPLAGYMSLFFGLIYLAYWCGILTTIYTL